MAALLVSLAGTRLLHSQAPTWTALNGPGFHTLSVARGARTVWAAGENGSVSRATF